MPEKAAMPTQFAGFPLDIRPQNAKNPALWLFLDVSGAFMYAIIEEGGRQFKVSTGDQILIDRAPTEDKSITLGRVLLVGGEGEPRIGNPAVAGATVTADVIGPEKGKKVLNVKYRRRKGYERTVGHRQKYLRVRVSAINV
jgi:large subunit ribosomal protein L21